MENVTTQSVATLVLATLGLLEVDSTAQVNYLIITVINYNYNNY